MYEASILSKESHLASCVPSALISSVESGDDVLVVMVIARERERLLRLSEFSERGREREREGGGPSLVGSSVVS